MGFEVQDALLWIAADLAQDIEAFVNQVPQNGVTGTRGASKPITH